MKKLRIFIFLSLIASFLLAFVGCSAKLETPTNLKIDQDTLILTWSDIEEANYYSLDINGEEYSANKNSYKLEKLDAGDYVIKVKAMGIGRSESAWSEEINFTREKETGMLFKLINGGTEYEVTNAGTVEGDVVVPAEYRKRPVTSIGKKAFSKKVKITSIVLPETITSIGESAFANCEFLTSINIPSAVTTIGKKAFQSCGALAVDVVIPSGVTVIEDGTFGYCRSIEKVTIGENVTKIGESAFADCESLKEIIIPDNVTEVGRYAFSACTAATNLSIGSGVVYLSESVFANCTSLTSVTSGAKVQAIGTCAFMGCTALTTFNATDALIVIEGEAFRGCTELIEVELSENVQTISSYAFYDTKIWTNATDVVYVGDWIVGCKVRNLTTITDKIKDTTVGIAAMSFAYSSEVTSLVLPDSVKYINTAAFGAMTKLASVVLGAGVEVLDAQAFAQCKVLKNVKLGSWDFDNGVLTGSSLKKIGKYAFQGCEMLSSIEIPETVDYIGAWAFRDTGMYKNASTGIVYAGNWVVDCNVNYLMSGDVTVTDGTVGVAEYAFYQAPISTIVMPDSVKYINRTAFYMAQSLLEVTLPSTLERIEEYTFFNCYHLRRVNLPETLTYVGKSAFHYCMLLGAGGDTTSLVDLESELVIPDSVKEIGDFAFFGCGYAEVNPADNQLYAYGIDKIVIGDGLEKVGTEAFAQCQSVVTLEIGDGLTEIGDYMFFKCISLQEITFGANVQKIDNRAFYGCTSLTSVTIPDTVTTIERYAFYKCENLETLNLGRGVETIGRSAFAGCAKISSLYIPANVKSIDKQAFRNVHALKSVVIEEGVEGIQNYAFYGCKLATFYIESATVPADWAQRWNSAYRPVVYGVTISSEGYVVSFVKKADTVKNVNEKTFLQEPIREGYKCIGWATSATAQTAEYVGNQVLNAPDNLVLYAVWQPIQN